MKPPQFYRTFDYQKSMLPNSYLASLEEGATSTEDATENTGYTIGYPGWGLIYYLLLSHIDPQGNNIIVETGTNIGCTTIVLAQAIKDSKAQGHVYTVELDSTAHNKASDNLKRAHVDRYVTQFNCDSRDALRQIVTRHPEIRFALLDASHLYNDVMQEFSIIEPFLSKHALVMFDNTFQIADANEDQRVNGALKAIQHQFGGNLVNLEYVSWYTPGFAIWQRNSLT